MDLKAVEEVVSKIQGQLFKNSNYYSIGVLKSHFKGSGLQFKEHQVYCHGDDVRFIDWKLLAKTQTPYIKTFEEERNIEIVVVIDTGLSMFLGVDGLSKLQAAINIAALLCLLAVETKDYVQIVFLGEDEVVLPKGHGKAVIVQMVSELRKMGLMNEDGQMNLAYRPKKKLETKKKTRSIHRFLASRKEVVLLSDFNNFIEEDELNSIVSRNNTHPFRLIAPLDKKDVEDFNLFGFDSNFLTKNGRSIFSLKANREKDVFDKKLGQKMKSIDLEKRYMEDFIKELL